MEKNAFKYTDEIERATDGTQREKGEQRDESAERREWSEQWKRIGGRYKRKKPSGGKRRRMLHLKALLYNSMRCYAWSKERQEYVPEWY